MIAVKKRVERQERKIALDIKVQNALNQNYCPNRCALYVKQKLTIGNLP